MTATATTAVALLAGHSVAGPALHASDPAHSRGRRLPEPDAPTRTAFQRDRVIHVAAFRRLVYKTQVFLNHEGDLFRTRLIPCVASLGVWPGV